MFHERDPSRLGLPGSSGSAGVEPAQLFWLGNLEDAVSASYLTQAASRSYHRQYSRSTVHVHPLCDVPVDDMKPRAGEEIGKTAARTV